MGELFRDTLADLSSQSQANLTITQIIDNIYKSAEGCSLIKEFKLDGGRPVKGPAWFNKDCVSAKKEMAIRLKVFRRAKRNQTGSFLKYLAEFLESKRTFKKVENAARKSFYHNIENKLRNAKDSKQFFQALELYRQKRTPLNKTRIPIDIFKDFFSNVYLDKLEENTGLTQTESDEHRVHEVEDLDKDFSMCELEIAIKN